MEECVELQRSSREGPSSFVSLFLFHDLFGVSERALELVSFLTKGSGKARNGTETIAWAEENQGSRWFPVIPWSFAALPYLGGTNVLHA